MRPMTADASALCAELGGRYRLERELGAGGMATVYLAHDVRHERDVALKVLRPGVAQALGRERFIQEIRLAARLNHPHILPLYDSGEAGGFLYFVMPVVQGRTLRDRLQQEGAWSVDEAVLIASEVADALDYAHRHDVVHRDIKPENSTLQAAGQIEAAQRLSARFHEVDPFSPFAGAMLCVCEWFSGNIGRHVDALERSRDMDPDNPIINWALGYTYALMGQTGDAARQAEWMRTHAPQLPQTVQLTSLVDGMEGRSQAALDALAKLDLAPLDAHHTFHIAESYAMAGDAARALALLEHAVDHGMYPCRFYADYCPFTVPLRGSAAFDRIVAKAARRADAFNS
jgi:tetratricopeptide (TPR) repeat protein